MVIFSSFVAYFVVTLLLAESSAEDEVPNLMLKEYTMCDEFKNTPVTFTTTITKHNATFFIISSDGYTPYDLGENIMLHVVIQVFENNEWTTLINFDEKDPCKLLEDYLGESWHELEKELSIPVGKCPIPKGRYKMDNYVLDLDTVIPTKSLPKGRWRIRANATQDSELVLCIQGEIESQ